MCSEKKKKREKNETTIHSYDIHIGSLHKNLMQSKKKKKSLFWKI